MKLSIGRAFNWTMSSLVVSSIFSTAIAFPVERALNDAAPPPAPGSERVMLVTPGINHDAMHLSFFKEALPYSKPIVLTEPTENALLQKAEDYAKTHGTLDELTIVAHGKPNRVMPAGPGTAAVDAKDVLSKLAAFQEKQHIKIANRIVFLSCNLFSGLSPQDVKDYRTLSHRLGADITAPTNEYVDGPYQYGRMTMISPDGVVKRDRLDIPVDTNLQSIAPKLFGLATGMKSILNDDSAWMKDAQKENSRADAGAAPNRPISRLASGQTAVFNN